MGGANLPGLARLETLGQRGIRLGLAAIDAVCSRLGRPERSFPAILSGGPNGKGSTAAPLSAIAAANGVRAGLYTSPHLNEVTERIRLEEKDVEAGELDGALSRVFAAAGARPAVPVTYFEAMTAAAFLLFAERRGPLAAPSRAKGGPRRGAHTLPGPSVRAVVLQPLH